MLRCVIHHLTSTFRYLFGKFLHFIVRRRGFWLRCLFCWGIGCLAFTTDETRSYDRRFSLRGDQKVSKDIVLVTIQQSDIAQFYIHRRPLLTDFSEISDIGDSYYWHKKTWSHLLSTILEQKPRSIGISLYFGENIETEPPTEEEKQIFHNPKISWSVSSTAIDKFFDPLFTNSHGSNLGIYDVTRDDDGVVRRIYPGLEDFPHLVEKLTQIQFPRHLRGLPLNFRGSNRSFRQYYLSDILSGHIPAQAFKDKIVIVGGEASLGHSFLTPVGYMTRAELFAQIADNLLENRWIIRFSFGWYALFMFLLMGLSVFIITQYPQFIAFYFFVWIGTLVAAVSAWTFDTFNIWIPTFSNLVLLITTWIVFIGYQAAKIERLNLRLKQDQIYLKELEQLKNNFVSLISHDLRTPLAKIQAVVDRMLVQQKDPSIQTDLQALKNSGDELNRYIRSILKVLRVEARDIKLLKEVADINQLIEEVIHQLTPLAKEKNIQLQLNLEPMFSVELDLTLIKEVILNLIENAIKYSKPGSVVSISSKELDTRLKVEVKDHGQGIRPEDLNNIWNKFTRGKDQDLKTKGSGLGLYLVKYFIELHGGQTYLQSEFGKGTTVSFTLPLTEET